MLWKLNRIQYPVYNLGTGKRIAIWVQGCTLACKGCISETLQSNTGGTDTDIEYLVNEILKISKEFDGITITGGEPFQQYPQLIAFSAYIKKLTDLEISIFSGYTLTELLKLYPDKLFMKFTDLLTDGRYKKDEHDDTYLRGSVNQELYKFENERALVQEPIISSNQISLNIDHDKQVYLTGMPKKNELVKLSEHMKSSGIELKFK